MKKQKLSSLALKMVFPLVVLAVFNSCTNSGSGDGTASNNDIDPKYYYCFKITHKAFEDAMKNDYYKFVLNTGLDNLADAARISLYYCSGKEAEYSAPMLASPMTGSLAGDIPTMVIIGNNEIAFADYQDPESKALLDFAYLKLCPIMDDNYLSFGITVWDANGNDITATMPRTTNFPEGQRAAKPSPPAPPAE